MAKVVGIEPTSQGFGDLRITVFPRRQKTGRECRIRTYDPLLPKQVRYQAALIPETLVTLNLLVELLRQHL